MLATAQPTIMSIGESARVINTFDAIIPPVSLAINDKQRRCPAQGIVGCSEIELLMAAMLWVIWHLEVVLRDAL
jgi:hypothetical protein